MSTVYEDYLFACARVTPNRRYYEAFSFVRQKIRLGTPDEVIIQEFRVLHNTLPTVYSIAKGKTLTQEVLDKFKRGLIEMDRRQEQRRILNQKKTDERAIRDRFIRRWWEALASKGNITPQEFINDLIKGEEYTYSEIEGMSVKDVDFEIERLLFRASLYKGDIPDADVGIYYYALENYLHQLKRKKDASPATLLMRKHRNYAGFKKWLEECDITTKDLQLIAKSKDYKVVKPSSTQRVEIKPTPMPTPSRAYTERVFVPRGFYKVPGMERVLEWARLQTWWEPWKANYKANSQTSLHEYVDSLRSPLNLIGSAFQWGITEEGSQYWNKVDEALREHVITEVRSFLMALKNRVSIDGPYTTGKESFYDLTGYGANIYGDEISLECLCAEVGLQLTEAPNDCYTFSLTTITK